MSEIEIQIDAKELKKKLGLKDGKTPSREELEKLIKPLIPAPVPGRTPVKGVDYDDGNDGSPDSPDDVVDKVNSSTKKIKPEQVAGLPSIFKSIEDYGKNPIGAVGGGPTYRFRQNGTVISDHVTDINFSTNLTGTYDGNGQITLTATDLDRSAEWGQITGTLASQTDLQVALDLKANLASPDFTGTISLNGSLQSFNTAQQAASNRVTPVLQNLGTSAAQGIQAVARFTSAQTGPGVYLGKSGGSSVGDYTAVSTNHQLGNISFQGADGTQFVESALIQARVNGTVSTGVVPTDVLINTMDSSGSKSTVVTFANNNQSIFANGSAALPAVTFAGSSTTGLYRATTDVLAFSTAATERMRISATGDVIIGTTSSNGRLYLGGTYTTANAQFVGMVGTLVSSVTSTQYGINNSMNFQPSGATLGNIYGQYVNPTITGGSSTITGFAGQRLAVELTTGFSGSISIGYGLRVDAPTLGTGQSFATYYGLYSAGITNGQGITSGSVNNYGLRVLGSTPGADTGGTVTNYGVFINVPTGANLNSGTTRNYGLYITGAGAVSATASYSLYNVSDKDSYFAANVGFGTTTPVSAAHIGSTTGGILTIGRTDTSVAISDSLGVLQWHSNDSTLTTQNIAANIEVIASAAYGTDAAQGVMLFRTTGTTVGGSPVERMRIDQTGKVGIGVTPTGQLHVKTASVSASNTTFKLEDSAGRSMFEVNDAGFVGMSTAPSALWKLDFVGQYFQMGSDSTSNNLRTDATVKLFGIVTPHYNNAQSPVWGIGVQTTSVANNVYIGGGVTSGANAATTISFATASSITGGVGAVRMALSNTLLRIGSGDATTTPAAVTLNGPRASGGTDIAGTNWTTVSGLATGSANSGDFIFQTGAPGASGSTIQTATTRLVVKGGTGNVGIGTTAPDKALEVNHATGGVLRLTYNDSDGSAANKVDFDVSSSGDLTITPSGGDATITGNVISTGYVKGLATTVASLPSAATAGAGARAFVTDANATTFLSIVAGGGANPVPVVSDGTNWLIG